MLHIKDDKREFSETQITCEDESFHERQVAGGYLGIDLLGLASYGLLLEKGVSTLHEKFHGYKRKILYENKKKEVIRLREANSEDKEVSDMGVCVPFFEERQVDPGKMFCIRKCENKKPEIYIEEESEEIKLPPEPISICLSMRLWILQAIFASDYKNDYLNNIRFIHELLSSLSDILNEHISIKFEIMTHLYSIHYIISLEDLIHLKDLDFKRIEDFLEALQCENYTLSSCIYKHLGVRSISPPSLVVEKDQFLGNTSQFFSYLDITRSKIDIIDQVVDFVRSEIIRDHFRLF